MRRTQTISEGFNVHLRTGPTSHVRRHAILLCAGISIVRSCCVGRSLSFK